MTYSNHDLSRALRLAAKGKGMNDAFAKVASLAPRVDYTDIETTIRNAVLENTAMTDPVATLVDTFLEGMKVNQENIANQRANIVADQDDANKEFEAQIARLNDEIKARSETHEAATVDFAIRIADADATLGAINASIGFLAAPEPLGGDASGGAANIGNTSGGAGGAAGDGNTSNNGAGAGGAEASKPAPVQSA